MERVFSDLQLLSPLSPDADPAVFDQDEPILIEMHGLISGVACTSYDCQYREPRFDSPICPALAGTEALVDLPEPEPTPNGARIQGAKRTPAEARAWAEARLAGAHVGPSIEPAIPAASLPRCSKCGALVRPDVVWFTEVPRQAETVMAVVDKTDVCIVVGTSAVVGFLQSIVATGRFAEVSYSPGTPCGDVRLKGQRQWRCSCCHQYRKR